MMLKLHWCYISLGKEKNDETTTEKNVGAAPYNDKNES